MILDPEVREALSFHGESGLGWSQVYDIIEFLGEARIVKAGYANRKEIINVRQTAKLLPASRQAEEKHAAIKSAHVSRSE